MPERVVLVDERDRVLGSEEKLAAHRDGRLHRAVSVLVFDVRGRLLLQKRASGKYHSGGLWSNTCCGHPRPGEDAAAAAHRRLREEMGFDCVLAPAFTFRYRAALGNGLAEHEYDHVFVGRFDGRPQPDPAEVADWRWEALDDLLEDTVARPEAYTAWFRILIGEHRHRFFPSGAFPNPD